jgi:hypothetical protein
MMQCVTCNKYFLFTLRLKALELQKKDKYLYGTKKKFANVAKVKDTNSFLYEFET